MATYERARGFIYRNARPLDFARWRYHFENGSAEDVLRALAAYQNADGGFGHALEADAWNPNSSPIQTWAATEILREIGCARADHPIVRDILRYLESGAGGDADGWFYTVPDNNFYPSAPWWRAEGEIHSEANPSAALAGFALRYADRDTALYQKAARIASKTVEAYLLGELSGDAHVTQSYLRLWEYGASANCFDADALRKRLMAGVARCVTADYASWDTSYVCKPSHFLLNRESPFYPAVAEAAEYECRYIVDSQKDDGAWSVNWRWRDFPMEEAVSLNWWKATGVLLNLLYLRGFGKLV